LGKDATEEKEKKHNGKLGIDRKTGDCPSFLCAEARPSIKLYYERFIRSIYGARASVRKEM